MEKIGELFQNFKLRHKYINTLSVAVWKPASLLVGEKSC
jgi:hypothetical protein